jgi:hypothetical protein
LCSPQGDLPLSSPRVWVDALWLFQN